MAALTAAVARRYRKWGYSVVQNWRVRNSATIYVGSFCAIPGTDALTSNRGYAAAYEDESTLQWVGLATGSAFNLSTTNTIVGDTSASPVPEVTTEAGPFILEQATVTGVSAQTDVRQPVYASNDNDLTVTASNSPIVGRVIYWYSSTTADVLFYGYLAGVVI